MHPCLIQKQDGFGGFFEANSAGVTQLVESLPSKQVVAGSSPVSRSTRLSDKLPWLKCQSWGKSESDKLHRADRNER